jgi:hypothetical protein
MGLSPDVIFELFLPAEPSTDQKAEIAGVVQGGLPVQVQQSVPPVWNPDKNVLTIGFWIVTDGFTEDQLVASLRASSFISGTGSMTVGLFNSGAYILLTAAEGLKLPKREGEPLGYIILDNLNVEVSSSVVTTLFGSYHPQILPHVRFTYTVTDSLTLNQSGDGGPPLKYKESTDLQWDRGGVIEEAVLVSMVNLLLGGVVFFGGMFGGGLFDPNAKGVGAQVANGWPKSALTPISPPLSGKVIFTWGELNVDDSGVRTLGTWNLAVRSPQVRIVGPTALSFKESAGSVSAGYTFKIVADLNGVASVVWGGDAVGVGLETQVNFGAPGDYTIQVSVTDFDNFTATAATNVTVKETKNGGHPA